MSSILPKNLLVGQTVSNKLTLATDYYTFNAAGAGSLILGFDSPGTFDWDEYILTIRDASNVAIKSLAIRMDKTITADLPKGGLYTLTVEAAYPDYPLPDGNYGITVSEFIKEKPTVSIAAIQPRVTEGTTPENKISSDFTSAEFRVTLSEPVTTQQTVYYTIVPVSNTLNESDFVKTASFLSNNQTDKIQFDIGKKEQIIKILVTKDSVDELVDEEFMVQLFNPTDGIKLDSVNFNASASIINDDRLSKASISLISESNLVEGSSPNGTTTYRFEVNLDKPTIKEQTIDYKIAFGQNGADRTDFAANMPTSKSAQLVIASGASKANIDIQVNNDLVPEKDESFSVILSNPSSQIALSSSKADAVIMNDDNGVMLSWSVEDVPQSNTKEGTSYTFSVKTEQVMTKKIDINYSIVGPTSLGQSLYSPTKPDDFKVNSGKFSIPIGKNEASFTITSVDDNIVESLELFKIALTLPLGVYMNPNGYEKYGFIADNDTASKVTLTNIGSILEGSKGKKTDLTIDVTLDKVQGDDQVINWNVSSIGTGTEYAAASDFVGGVLPSGTLTIKANSKTGKIVIPIQGDDLAEMNETFKLNLQANTNGIKFGGSSTSSSIIQINNDEGIVGTKNADTLKGTNGNDFILGYEGNDVIRGEDGGIDFIYGGDGNDLIYASSLSTILAGKGNDAIGVIFLNQAGDGSASGQEGSDILSFNYGNYVNINTGTATSYSSPSVLTFDGFENFQFYGDNYVIEGSPNNEYFFLTYTSNTSISGGLGADTFDIAQSIKTGDQKFLKINDFSLQDRIVIKQNIKFNSNKLTIKNVSQFSGEQGQMQIVNNGTNTFIQIDANGDRYSDITIELVGVFDSASLIKVIA